jgi:hypothetical protein
MTRLAQDLEHQIGADVAGAEDGNSDLMVCSGTHQKRASILIRTA